MLPMDKKIVDWASIEKEYRTGQASMRALANKYRINVSSISRRAKRRGWAQGNTATPAKIATPVEHGNKPKKKQNQPKTHASKTKQAVELRRKKIINEIINGKTYGEAGASAGLSPKTAASQVNLILRKPEFRQLLNEAVPDDYQTQKYREILDATKVISANIIAKNGEGMADAHSMTKDFIDVPDYPTQLRANDSISKLKGYLEDKPAVSGPVTISVVYDQRQINIQEREMVD
jgi:hypothetical protein